MVAGSRALVGLAVVLALVRCRSKDEEPISVPSPSSAAAAEAPVPSAVAPAADGGTQAADAGPVAVPRPVSTTSWKPSPDDYCTKAIAAAGAKRCDDARSALAQCSGARRPTAQANVTVHCSSRKRR